MTTARLAERRWPLVLAVAAAGVLNQLLPGDFRVIPAFVLVFPVFLLVFLAVLLLGDLSITARRRRSRRAVTTVMIGCITLTAALGAFRLVRGILTHASFSTAGQLLTIGVVAWLTNIIAFSLWFWDLDGGGASARASGSSGTPPAFVFPEMGHPDLVPAGWYPQFVDYLALSFNVALAFSPTDVSAIRRWAKLMIVLESLISLVIAALVIARAINIL